MRAARPLRLAAAALSLLCLGLTLLASVLWYLQLKGDVALLFHSDTDFLPALYRDLVEQGGKLSRWNLTPAPSFFPDWPMFFAANYFAGDLFHALPAFFVLQGVLLFVLAAAVLGRCAAPHQALAASGWACALLFCWAMAGMVPYSYFYLSAFHCGVFLLSLLSLRLLDGERPHWPLFGVALLATLSDRLYLLQFALPAMLALCCLARRGGPPWRRLCAFIALGCIAGILLYKARWLVGRPQDLPWRMALSAVPANLQGLLHMLEESWRASPAGTLGLAAYYAALTALLPGTLLGRGWRIADPAAARLALFNWLVAAGCLAAVLVSTNTFTVRYFIPAYVLPLLAGPALLYTGLAPRRQRWLTALLLAATVWLTLGMLLPALRDVDQVKPAYYPAEVACLDQVIARHGLRHGVASYWDAKRIGMLSRHRPAIAPYDEQLRAFHWITSESVFRADYDFALVRHVDGLDLATLIALNGQPAERVDCGEFAVAAFPNGGLKRGFKP